MNALNEVREAARDLADAIDQALGQASRPRRRRFCAAIGRGLVEGIGFGLGAVTVMLLLGK